MQDIKIKSFLKKLTLREKVEVFIRLGRDLSGHRAYGIINKINEGIIPYKKLPHEITFLDYLANPELSREVTIPRLKGSETTFDDGGFEVKY